MPPPATMYDKRLDTPYEDWPWQIDDIDIAGMGLMQARYYALVQEADYHIGRMLDALDEFGLAENTLVVFLSDHGEFLGDHGIMQKFLPYQEAIRVPLLMRLPGQIPAGTVVEHPVNTCDVFATIFDYLGLTCPEQEGMSLRALIEGGSNTRSNYTFSEFDFYSLFVSNDWKYVWHRDPQHVDMLYDLRRDPFETVNLLGSNPDRQKYLSTAETIRREMITWMERIEHPYLEQLVKSAIR